MPYLNRYAYSVTPKLDNKVLKLNTLSCNKYSHPSEQRKYQPDLRPLADQTYHHQCTEKILKFCSSHNYAMRKESLKVLSTNEIDKLFSVSSELMTNNNKN